MSIAGRELAIFNLGPSTELGAGDRFLAVDNQCPHKAGPLADGIVTGTSVVCPLHTWKISLVDGCVQRPQVLVSTASRHTPCVWRRRHRRERADERLFSRWALSRAGRGAPVFDVSFTAWILLGPLALSRSFTNV